MSDIRKYLNLIESALQAPLPVIEAKETLTEGVEAHGNELVAYCWVVAEQYIKMPTFDTSALPLWEEMLKHNKTMLAKVMKHVNIVYVENDPYKNQREMMYDILKNNRMMIFKTPSDDSHPGMSAQENDVFRALHDFIGHYQPNYRSFVKYLADNNIKSSADPEFKNIRFSKNSFTVRGEMNTYFTHGKLLSDKVKPVLFTEVVGQICTYFATGDFTVNKVGVMQGIDFKRLGKFTDASLNARKQSYLEQLEDDDVEVIETELGSMKKSEIRWNLLSRGEGQKRK